MSNNMLTDKQHAYRLVAKMDEILEELKTLMPRERELIDDARTHMGFAHGGFVGQRNICEVIDEYDFELDDEEFFDEEFFDEEQDEWE